ncbi:hypothetical protein FB451DRAFT_1414261 [Mycena latifolia]|nr:hypothetical protein FB451DRAFT_1414261 [Mycena latifolia]
MDPFLVDYLGNPISSTWSLKGGTWWCSLGGPSSGIPPRAMIYAANPPFLLQSSTPQRVSADLNFTKYASWHKSEEHWLGWSLTGPPRETPLSEYSAAADPTTFLFNGEDAKLDAEYTDLYGVDSDDGNEARSTLVGYSLSSAWSRPTIQIGCQLHDVCMKLADGHNFYGWRSWLGERGDVPPALDEGPLRALHHTKEEARLAEERAKRSILSFMGFISWFLTLVSPGTLALSEEQRKLVHSLFLKERPKAGVMYKLSCDYHEVSMAHLLQHGVPVHYVWTDDERGQGRFLRLSPEYWNKFSVLREGAEEPDKVDITLLPSYDLWREDLERYDWCFQDLKAGKMGTVITGFKPYWIYRLVDHRLYGARTLTHWNVIRACVERFKGTVAETPIGTVCTFFRQNPLEIDEPPHARVWPSNHRYELTDFAKEPLGEEIAEGKAFYESSSRVREQVKNRWAPRQGRTFSSFNGVLQGPAPTTRPRKRAFATDPTPRVELQGSFQLLS